MKQDRKLRDRTWPAYRSQVPDLALEECLALQTADFEQRASNSLTRCCRWPGTPRITAVDSFSGKQINNLQGVGRQTGTLCVKCTRDDARNVRRPDVRSCLPMWATPAWGPEAESVPGRLHPMGES